MRSTANKFTIPRMIPSWQKRSGGRKSMPCAAPHQRTRQRVFLSGSKNQLGNMITSESQWLQRRSYELRNRIQQQNRQHGITGRHTAQLAYHQRLLPVFSLSSAPLYKPFYPDNAANHWFVARFSVFMVIIMQPLPHFSVDSSRFFRYCAGLTPYSFLNTRLK